MTDNRKPGRPASQAFGTILDIASSPRTTADRVARLLVFARRHKPAAFLADFDALVAEWQDYVPTLRDALSRVDVWAGRWTPQMHADAVCDGDVSMCERVG